MLSPLVTVTTCYHALIHYCYLVIEVTRRHEVLLADQGDREPESVESFGSAPVSLSSGSSSVSRCLDTLLVDQGPCRVELLFHVPCSPHRRIIRVWPGIAYEAALLVDYRTTFRRATNDSGQDRQHIRRPRRRPPPLPSDSTPARTSVHRYIVLRQETAQRLTAHCRRSTVHQHHRLLSVSHITKVVHVIVPQAQRPPNACTAGASSHAATDLCIQSSSRRTS